MRETRDRGVVVALPNDPLGLIRLARSGQYPEFLDRIGRLFLSTHAEENADANGQGRSERYRRTEAALTAYIAGLPSNVRADVEEAYKVVRRYVEEGEPGLGSSSARTVPFYLRVNDALRRAGSLSALETQNPAVYRYYANELVPSVEKLPGKVQGVVFRGTSLPHTVIDDLIDGRTKTYAQLAPMSTSVSLPDAIAFLRPRLVLPAYGIRGPDDGREPTLMIIESKSGKLVSIGSDFAREEEVLLLHPARFDVLAAFRGNAPRDDSGINIAYVILKER